MQYFGLSALFNDWTFDVDAAATLLGTELAFSVNFFCEFCNRLT